MTTTEIKSNLDVIREAIDTNPSCADMQSVLDLGSKLSSLIGLSAECQSQAQRHLKLANLNAMRNGLVDDTKPSLAIRAIDALCADEIAMYEYACRINAGITHKLDFIRTQISLHKVELEKGLI